MHTEWKHISRMACKGRVGRIVFACAVLSWYALMSLAQRANVDVYEVEILCDSPVHALAKFRQTITIKDERGARLADFVCSVGNGDRLTFVRGTVTDEAGKTIYKFKGNELKRTEYSEYLSIDESIYYMEYTPNVYPVRITYEWTIDYNDRIVEFPHFSPQMDYDVSVGKARYTLTAPEEMGMRYYLQNIPHDAVAVNSHEGKETFILETDSLPPLRKEPYAKPFDEICSRAVFAPSEFVYCGTRGRLDSWRDYGLWEYGLIDGTEILPEEARRYVHKMTDGLTGAREKVEVLYRELAKNTRYVAILLGIGGQKPAHASSVWKGGYGDCKGLTNYMRAMLKETGIESYYVTVNTEKPRLIPDFASVGQLNHAVLEIPLENDTLWVECTNPQYPLGYIHEGIAGHDAVEISQRGGRVVRIPAYADAENLRHSTISMQIDDRGNANISMVQKYHNQRYEQYSYLLRLDKNELRKELHKIVNVPQMEVAEIDFGQEGASIRMETAMRSTQYAAPTGSRLFIPVYPLYTNGGVPEYQHERQGDIWFPTGYCDEEEITIQIPEGYVVESLPASVREELPFATFSSDISEGERNISIKNRLKVNAGSYEKEYYTDLVEFAKRTLSIYKKKIVIKKKPI